MQARIYKNLNKGGMWSIKQRIDGKWQVVGHCSSCALDDVTPHVSDARHNHVRKGNHREVFAWLVGDLVWVDGFVPYKGREAQCKGGYPKAAFNSGCLVSFHPFAEQKRGFVWDMYYGELCCEDFSGSDSAYFTDNGQVYA